MHHRTILLAVYFVPEIIFVTCENLTWKKVSSCPRNEEEWIIAARRLNCSCYKQSCVYHCLRNEFKNSTLEGCAKAKPIVGQYCAEYNVFGRRINYNVNIKCGNKPCPCPVSYLSNETFKYPSCLLIEQNKGLCACDSTIQKGLYANISTEQKGLQANVSTKQKELCANVSTHCLQETTNTCVSPVIIAVTIMILLWLIERSVVGFSVIYSLEYKRKEKSIDEELGTAVKPSEKVETDNTIKNDLEEDERYVKISGDRDTVEDPLLSDNDAQGHSNDRNTVEDPLLSDNGVQGHSNGSSESKHIIVINIGNKFSAYGFSHNMSAVQMQSAGKRNTSREPSALLFLLNKTTGKIEFDVKTTLFGFDAKEKYGKLESQEERNLYSFFPKIKLERKSERKFVVKDITGNERDAEEILKYLISWLQKMAFHRIRQNKDLKEPTEDNTIYVIVSIFDIPEKKDILTEAAKQAGIPDEHLMVIKQADTYSLCLRQVKDEMNCLNCSLSDISKMMKVNDIYMALDLGRGGANIVKNVIGADGTDATELHEYLKWGDESIRTRIAHVSVALFGKDCTDELKKNHYSKYVGIMDQIDDISEKISFGYQGDISINLPPILEEIVKQKTFQSLQNVVTRNPHKYAKFVTIHESEDNIQMKINPAILQELFKPALKMLKDFLLKENAPNKDGKVTFVYLIGEYANYKFMQEKVIKLFHNTPVILPSSPELVVMKGAPYHKDVKMKWNMC